MYERSSIWLLNPGADVLSSGKGPVAVKKWQLFNATTGCQKNHQYALFTSASALILFAFKKLL
jgi:hypothetical protein